MLRAEISQICSQNNISKSLFYEVGKLEWSEIEKKFYSTFCHLKNSPSLPRWLWTDFKLPFHHLDIPMPQNSLDKFVNSNELVWFWVTENTDKFWLYEGKINEIKLIINESCYIDELYVISKKYEWLICINHHNTLIVVGQKIIDIAKKLI